MCAENAGLPVFGGCQPKSACHLLVGGLVCVCFSETTDAANELHQKRTFRNRAAAVARVLSKVDTHVVPSGCLALGLGASRSLLVSLVCGEQVPVCLQQVAARPCRT